MQELTLSIDPIPSLAGVGELRRRHGGYRTSYRKNVCLITMNGSWNGFSMWNVLNGFGGF